MVSHRSAPGGRIQQVSYPDHKTVTEWGSKTERNVKFSLESGSNSVDDVIKGSEKVIGSSTKSTLETGARNLDNLSVKEILALDDEAADIYNLIRNSSDDIAKMSNQAGIPK